MLHNAALWRLWVRVKVFKPISSGTGPTSLSSFCDKSLLLASLSPPPPPPPVPLVECDVVGVNKSNVTGCRGGDPGVTVG